MPDLSVITIVRGRLDHLRHQEAALRAQPTPYERVVVQMGGPDVRPVLASDSGSDSDGTVVLAHADPGDDGMLPLARARNAGVAAATTDRLVLLDVDCIPAPTLLARYADALDRAGGLVAGPVAYLPPGVDHAAMRRPALLAELAEPHPARPNPAPGTLVREDRYELFWSLSFAVQRADWDLIGGFCERYRGYGGEDTDFSYAAREAGVPLHWVGGAVAWHQHHEVESPPRRHLAEIVDNAWVFRERWGSWPMVGWLAAFRDEGLVRWEPSGEVLEVVGRDRSDPRLTGRDRPTGHLTATSTPEGAHRA